MVQKKTDEREMQAQDKEKRGQRQGLKGINGEFDEKFEARVYSKRVL